MERKKIEIEAKFSLDNIDNTLCILDKVSNRIENNNMQKDMYFTPAHENFIKATPVSEWLRIRITPNESTINYKDWSNKGENNKITCKEIEVGLDDSNGMLEILNALDFENIVTVEKTRNTWEYNGILISVDSIVSLGNYIELEFKTNIFDNEEDSLEFILKTINELGISVGEQIFAGYPQLLMKKNEI